MILRRGGVAGWATGAAAGAGCRGYSEPGIKRRSGGGNICGDASGSRRRCGAWTTARTSSTWASTWARTGAGWSRTDSRTSGRTPLPRRSSTGTCGSIRCQRFFILTHGFYRSVKGGVYGTKGGGILRSNRAFCATCAIWAICPICEGGAWGQSDPTACGKGCAVTRQTSRACSPSRADARKVCRQFGRPTLDGGSYGLLQNGRAGFGRSKT